MVSAVSISRLEYFQSSLFGERAIQLWKTFDVISGVGQGLDQLTIVVVKADNGFYVFYTGLMLKSMKSTNLSKQEMGLIICQKFEGVMRRQKTNT